MPIVFKEGMTLYRDESSPSYEFFRSIGGASTSESYVRSYRDKPAQARFVYRMGEGDKIEEVWIDLESVRKYIRLDRKGTGLIIDISAILLDVNHIRMTKWAGWKLAQTINDKRERRLPL